MFPAFCNVTLYIIYAYVWCYCCGNSPRNVEKKQEQGKEGGDSGYQQNQEVKEEE